MRGTVTTAGVLYNGVLEGRYPPRTNQCDPNPRGSAPVADDPTTSEYLLRILCARWNKANTLADCDGRTAIVQSVMNPRTRLWGAAVTYALQDDANNVNKLVRAEFDPLRNAAVFKHRWENSDILIVTDDGLGEVNPAYVEETDAVYRVTVAMYRGRATRQLPAQQNRTAIANYAAADLNVNVTFEQI
tara:strand:+ start:1708 stop:2271 length:564 start_codon:yes stop_codon:yes gene_type:complete